MNLFKAPNIFAMIVVFKSLSHQLEVDIPSRSVRHSGRCACNPVAIF